MSDLLLGLGVGPDFIASGATGAILQEDGFNILQEDGTSKILQET